MTGQNPVCDNYIISNKTIQVSLPSIEKTPKPFGRHCVYFEVRINFERVMVTADSVKGSGEQSDGGERDIERR
jgi:hypothetical protein